MGVARPTLLHDRDSAFAEVAATIADMQIRDLVTAHRSVDPIVAVPLFHDFTCYTC